MCQEKEEGVNLVSLLVLLPQGGGGPECRVMAARGVPTLLHALQGGRVADVAWLEGQCTLLLRLCKHPHDLGMLQVMGVREPVNQHTREESIL